MPNQNYYLVNPYSGSIFFLPCKVMRRDNPEDKTITVHYAGKLRRFKREDLSLTLEDAKRRSMDVIQSRIRWVKQAYEDLEMLESALSDVQNLTDDTLCGWLLVQPDGFWCNA